MDNLPEGLATSGAIEIAEELKLISGGKVLDVGSGNGDFIDTLMKALKDYNSFFGVDKSEKEVKTARKRLKGKPVEIKKMNAEALEFENNSFDVVCLSYSLHHLDHITKVLTEMKRVLKPDGYFIIQENFSDGEQTEAQKTETLQHHWGAEIDTLLGKTHNKTFTKQEIKNIVNNIKLKEVKIFESTHPVKCIFCKDKFECENPRNVKVITQSLKEIDDALKRLKGHDELTPRARLEEEGEELRERIMTFGVSSAAQLFIVGIK